MSKRLKITDEQRKQASRDIKNFFAFTEEVLEDPSILDSIPDGAEVDAIPKEERDKTRQYDIETPTMVATVVPPTLKRHARAHGDVQPTANVSAKDSPEYR